MTPVELWPAGAARRLGGSMRDHLASPPGHEPVGWETYGRPSPAVGDAMRRAAAAAGVTLRLEPEVLGGFIRLAAG